MGALESQPALGLGAARRHTEEEPEVEDARLRRDDGKQRGESLQGMRPREGDVVILGPRSPPEFRQCPAVVTRVAEVYCDVVVLDDSKRFGVGECWPSFDDIVLVSSAFRLGARVVVAGLTKERTRHLNGCTGSVTCHPRNGHPTFVHKASSPDRPQLTLCVGLDDPAGGKVSSVLLEPRFLRPLEECFLSATQRLGDVLASLDTKNGLVPA